ncbi:MAG: Asp-tRNA(Asn)/Glu-tRNA(Gln) amidotransferase GatCAB subunit C [Micrococcales bacterium]|nr:MAG: Asp-tRNA(Asn)/Glu-tRNA(Gln) amidotransferase GatCAB subunit C [Micrococcales bacterium]PIE27535.1 MAG: Asp-tRNA(Asn)/Glu-tRNA(Gln) amidotransferase GatCAB subunit C [Micrococcales bacterium]
MPLRTQDVAKLAALARIDLTDDELDIMTGELQAILSAVRTVSEAVGPHVEATSHPIAMTNVFRADVVTPGLTQDQALSGAPQKAEGRFQVPRILDEE